MTYRPWPHHPLDVDPQPTSAPPSTAPRWRELPGGVRVATFTGVLATYELRATPIEGDGDVWTYEVTRLDSDGRHHVLTSRKEGLDDPSTLILRAKVNTVPLSAYLHALRSGHPTPDLRGYMTGTSSDCFTAYAGVEEGASVEDVLSALLETVDEALAEGEDHVTELEACSPPSEALARNVLSALARDDRGALEECFWDDFTEDACEDIAEVVAMDDDVKAAVEAALKAVRAALEASYDNLRAHGRHIKLDEVER